MFSALEMLAKDLAEMFVVVGLGTVVLTLAGFAIAAGLRTRGLRWTWSLVLLPFAMALTVWSTFAMLASASVCLVGCFAGAIHHARDMTAGGDLAETARSRLGVLATVIQLADRWQEQHERWGWVHNGQLEVGRDERGRRVSIRVGERSGSHTLIVGATGSGKTCTQAWIAGRLIEHGHAAIAIDPKGDELLREELRRAAARRGVPFLCWTPEGELGYNPFAYGSDSEIADKALAGETFTEPHYLRQAQRYLGHVVRTMRAARVTVTAASLMAHMEPAQLEATASALPAEEAVAVRSYLESLGERQRRELAGARDRLSILAESEVAPWLCLAAAQDASDGTPQPRGAFSLPAVVKRRAVVYFSLEADRRPLLAQMLGAAIVADLVTLAAERRSDPIPTLVLIDEFFALGARQIASLFSRGRDAGMSLVLSTQEMADLTSVGERALRDQVIGNIEGLIAFRQNVPESAELIAQIAGARPAWVTTQQTVGGLLGPRFAGRGSRTRGHEPIVHPSLLKELPTGHALVVRPGSGAPPVIARMRHTSEATL